MNPTPVKSSKLSNDEHALWALIEQRVEDCLALAARQYQRSFHYAQIQFNLKGRAAGQIKFSRSKQSALPTLRFNPIMLARHGLDFVDTVVPHECAHLVAFALHGFRIKPHGAEWKSLMQSLYQLPPSVTHRFEVPVKPKVSHLYSCRCAQVQHKLSATRHNRIVRKQVRYICKKCGSALKFGSAA